MECQFELFTILTQIATIAVLVIGAILLWRLQAVIALGMEMFRIRRYVRAERIRHDDDAVIDGPQVEYSVADNLGLDYNSARDQDRIVYLRAEVKDQLGL